MMTIIDYGCGNIKAFVNVFSRLNIPVLVARSKQQIEDASRIILPGVGAFDYVMHSFNKSGLRDIVEKKVLQENVPVLGVCAGMQIMANSSEEGKEHGLGWIPGKVKMFDLSKIPYVTKNPHMGWNEIKPVETTIFSKIPEGSRFYFVHSYYFEEENSIDAIARTNYGIDFTSAVSNSNIFGTQFHPEKSHSNGMQLLKNFASI
jgi:imidazole glycerol-phosphate synthase subunit HisH